MIPVSPINGLFRTATFVQQEWDDILSKEAIVTGADTTNPWLSLLLVNEAVINQADALAKLATTAMDDGLSRSWALYNAASRGGLSSSSSTTVATVARSITTATPTVTTPSPIVTTATPEATIVTMADLGDTAISTVPSRMQSVKMADLGATTGTTTVRSAKGNYSWKDAVGQV